MKKVSYPFQVGDKVKIIDGSYMTSIENGKITHYTKNIPAISKNMDEWIIVDIGDKYPIVNNITNINNNMIIQNLSNNEVWYCSYVNLKRIEPEYVVFMYYFE